MQRQDSVAVSRRPASGEQRETDTGREERPAFEGDINTTGSVQAALDNLGETTPDIEDVSLDTRDDIERYAMQKTRDYIEEHDFSFSADDIHFSIRSDMTRYRAKAGWHADYAYFSVSEPDWEGTSTETKLMDFADTILHELCHIEVGKVLGIGGHGPAWRWLARHVGIDAHAEKNDGCHSQKWQVMCDSCGARWSYSKRCATVKRIERNREREDPWNNCGRCDDSRLDVEGRGVLEVKAIDEVYLLNTELKPRYE